MRRDDRPDAIEVHGTRVHNLKNVDESALVPDESKSIDEGAAAPWGTLMWSLMKDVCREMGVLHDLGLGYLTHGEATPSLSGGEAQRLKLASEMDRDQSSALFVFDEPTIELHPLDVELLLSVFQRLVDKGATLVVIEHDLDVIANADWVVDLGPGGGERGGRIVCAGTPAQVAACPANVDGLLGVMDDLLSDSR